MSTNAKSRTLTRRTWIEASMISPFLLTLALFQGVVSPPPAQRDEKLLAELDKRVTDVAPQVIRSRRDLHEHPELSNREFRTSRLVAGHLKALGLEVREHVAHTGVVGVLWGNKTGCVVCLRADMDALPVTVETGLPFASTVRTEYEGREVGVMHACGHDAHTAMLMGVATVLAGPRDRLPGTVVFLFQPAEEGAPEGEQGGAELMIKEGAFDDPRPEAIFGLHVFPGPVGQLSARPEGIMASGDPFRMEVVGRQAHGAIPWLGVDPIVVASQIVLGLQTIVSRQSDLTRSPAVVTVGRLQAGIRANIIPDKAELQGTIRTFDPAMREDLLQRVRRTAERIAESAGATAHVKFEPGYPVTYNDPDLTALMTPTLRRVVGGGAYTIAVPRLTSEDFSCFQKEVPGLFFFLGVTPNDQNPATAAPNHSPRFLIDEGALSVGVRALAHLAVDFLVKPKSD
jgi:amidohydrolase